MLEFEQILINKKMQYNVINKLEENTITFRSDLSIPILQMRKMGMRCTFISNSILFPLYYSASENVGN